VNETTATAAELSASQKQVIQTAANVAQVGHKAATAVGDGQHAIDQTLRGLTDIRSKTQATTQRIIALSDRSQQVGKIVGAIKDLAGQTNMLALNAAIEAARAGDEGKGFAVVASEVRQLAERTKKLTEDVTDLVGAMQSSTTAAVMATEDTLKSVEDGHREAVLARQLFENIAVQVSETGDAIKQIHVSCQQQDSATGQIAAAMSQINAGMKQTVAAVEQNVAASAGLRDTAVRLKGLVG
jgi:methyl-accepting chemotaxis protein